MRAANCSAGEAEPAPVWARVTYWIVGSLSGTCPGFPIADTQVPINLDDYLAWTLDPLNTPLVSGLGVLNHGGRAEIQLVVPPATEPALAGTALWHAAVVYDLAPFTVLHISNPTRCILDE
jgi:hypothetical protein